MSKQEPVAYVTGFYKGHCVIEPLDRATVLPVGMALYRAPTEWVGLTDEEIKALPSWWPSYEQMPALMTLARDIENLLKEQNT